MQVKASSAPVEARGSWYGSCGAFVAVSPHVASMTLMVNDRSGWAEPQPSVWVSLPYGRDVLVGACMVSEGYGLDDVTAMSTDGFREWVLSEVAYYGTRAAKEESYGDRFAAGYADDAEAARFFAVVSTRVDEAFGFGGAGAPAQLDQAHDVPTPARGLAGLVLAGHLG